MHCDTSQPCAEWISVTIWFALQVVSLFPHNCVGRYSCSSAVCGDHLLLVGGVDWNASNPDIIAISLATRQWSMLHLTLVG